MNRVMGPTGAGKTTFINTVTGSTKLQVSDELESCTQEVQLSDPFVFQDRNVVFIDTPGFDDADADRSDADILRMVSQEANARRIGVPQRHSQVRMSGSACNNLRIFRKLCGDPSLRNVAILTTMWSTVNGEEAEKRHRNLEEGDKYFGEMIKHGASRFDTEGSGGGWEGMGGDTGGGELSRQLDQKAEKIESRIVRLQEEAAEATKEEDAEALREVQAMLAKSEEELLKVKNEKKKLRGGLVGAVLRFLAGMSSAFLR
ncbi:hypothetical protein FA13DRAFT_1713030 [Coprinellus micaceus]|uniref:G domain-containing protein n=1 Tax=Coprinellus micaceus TaxID=71717 RepID=A0A4Y7SYE7_COPMI|nr:hypothetical protein FA13DRAFT_1713030 [Coprinellus micaceus]